MAGHPSSRETWKFMVDQVTYDAARLGCGNLTQWRWAIKSRPRPKPDILNIAHTWPRKYPRCGLVGMPADISVWQAHGMSVRVDYTFKAGRFTIVGVNCGNTKVLLSKDYYNRNIP